MADVAGYTGTADGARILLSSHIHPRAMIPLFDDADRATKLAAI